MTYKVHHIASMSAAATSTQYTLPPTPTIPLIPRRTHTHTFTSPALSPAHAKPSRVPKATKASKALLTFPAFTDGNPFSSVAEEKVKDEVVEEEEEVVEEVVVDVEEVDRCKDKAKAKAVWIRKQEKLREEWVMDVFKRTGRVPMCPWPGVSEENGRVRLGEKGEEEGEKKGRGEPLAPLAILGGGAEEEEEKKKKEKA